MFIFFSLLVTRWRLVYIVFLMTTVSSWPVDFYQQFLHHSFELLFYHSIDTTFIKNWLHLNIHIEYVLFNVCM